MKVSGFLAGSSLSLFALEPSLMADDTPKMLLDFTESAAARWQTVNDPAETGTADKVALYERYAELSVEHPSHPWLRGWCRSSAAACARGVLTVQAHLTLSSGATATPAPGRGRPPSPWLPSWPTRWLTSDAFALLRAVNVLSQFRLGTNEVLDVLFLLAALTSYTGPERVKGHRIRG